ncbi:site-specific DNA-methyltransferase [Heyndrickxia sporothermodurans]|uniref:Type III restriction-modification system methylation subunit n=1 Tax=Heyndrickxia sporothermodurans TaxID=46224 RepID=A0A150LFB6_9BACI|nr:site-specific DNA-methyltransferase [Heyndrickxia sporothermodurans]KYD11053.1 Type III restriction-modification system methylation subunit [Heyndrickxia sporothermodurans]MED3649604.1 site-specific DNA-methyltransferase [Heyndrickxia sporothermodurans]MED3699900.1 site-specific DNA-methyltransferase [Heyndrickxia sporothermodurans]
MSTYEQEVNVEQHEFEPIKGYPMLNWKGKRPFRSTQYYPAQLKETHGEVTDGWINKIFWGDNLQVMSHLLKEYRGKIKLIYIDPPFDSKAEYKKKIKLKGKQISNDLNAFEEVQYTDMWTNDEYLQFMYERLILIRELLSEDGSLYLHCDWHKSHYLRCICDEIFGAQNFRNEIVWSYFGFKRSTTRKFPQKHDILLSYVKSEEYIWNVQYQPHSEEYIKRFKKDENGRLYRDDVNPTGGGSRVIYLDEVPGDIIDSVWNDIPPVNPVAKERQNYPTQKPEKLLERIINASTNLGDIVFDCFMGSGTAQAVSLKNGRKFIGSDINLGAVQTTTKRLTKILAANEKSVPGFEVYNVNNYDIFRNPVQAKELLIEALEVQPIHNNSIYDGEKDGRMVKIMPVNRIASRADLNELITNFDYKSFEKRQIENPNQPVERLLLVCMGHEPDLAAALEQEVGYKLDIEVVDILRDKSNLEFKRDSEAEVIVDSGNLIIKNFYPMSLLQKLSIMKENVEDWKELVESVMIDWNYDGAVLEPTVVDIPEKNELVSGIYKIPEDAGTIRVKITDLLSESFEVSIDNG